MRKFSSYGPIEPKKDYYVPRTELIQYTYNQLVGEKEDEGGHYITVWAPRQSGKTWVMRQVCSKIRQEDRFEICLINMQPVKNEVSDTLIFKHLINELREKLNKDLPFINSWQDFPSIFKAPFFAKPLILILDEFDALLESHISNFANIFRYIYLEQPIDNKHPNMLYGLALIGVRSVLGIENETGSPFNVQRSVKIPNLTDDEVRSLFNWYEKESGQNIEPEVIEKIIYEFRGQPGLTCWFGELLTEKYNETPDQTINLKNFKRAFKMALHALPNNNILNIISKVKITPYKEQILELFKTDNKANFSFNNPMFTYLYMVGAIDYEEQNDELYVKFHAPFIQKSLFNYFSNEIFSYMGTLTDPFAPIDKIITPHDIDIKSLIRLYEIYLKKNREWLLKKAPRRSDLRIYEAVFHFNFYLFLYKIIRSDGEVIPEFPTGNGKVDIIIRYKDKIYALELKSFTDINEYHRAIEQAHNYAVQLNQTEITLVFFVESIDDDSRNKYELSYIDQQTGIKVDPVFAVIG